MRLEVAAHGMASSAPLVHVRRNWTTYQAGGDALLWALAVTAATLLRFDLRPAEVNWSGLGIFAALGAGAVMLSGASTGLYRRRWRYGSFEEFGGLAWAVITAGTALVVLNATLASRLVPMGVALATPVLAMAAMTGVRYIGRAALERQLRPASEAATPVLVYGAGDAGTQLVRALVRNPSGAYLPVGLLDDDPSRRNLRISGVRVLGGRADIAAAVRRSGAELVVLAIPSATGETLRDIAQAVGEAGVPVRTLPSVEELVSGKVTPADIRELTEADLLGRRAIDTDLDAIAAYVTGKRVLVTGAGGSIGAELCRQLNRFAPERLVMVDRDESALHAVQLSLDGRARLDSRDVVVADIRDADRIHEVFAEHRPTVVFHAAALKHVPLLEMYPGEAVKTNVLGTANVLAAAKDSGVDRFVNVSTDKAANPGNVLGYTKRITERLTARAARETGRAYVSVRFGNVIGSRGSVLPAFQAMIAAGGPVTVTDPRVTRYFMTIPEAVQLIIQAGAIGTPESVLILDMGSPVRIDEVARRLIAASGRDVPLVYTGLRPGEKVHEDLFDHQEIAVPSAHPLITMAAVEPLSVDVSSLCRLGPQDVVPRLRILATIEPAAGPLQRTG